MANETQYIDLTLLFCYNSIAVLFVMAITYLVMYRQTLLLILVFAFTLFVCIQSFGKFFSNPMQNMSFIKLMLLLPMGLGVILLLIRLPKEIRNQYYIWYSNYINMAVLLNIFAMLFTPDGGTYRGYLSRLVCLALLIWLLQEMRKKRFQTIHFDQGLFLFRSSPLHWILCHATYRIVLLSLPSFETQKFLLLEPLSLIVMFSIFSFHKKRFALEQYFGFADTLVVTTITVLSWYPILLPFKTNGPYIKNLNQNEWDMILIPLQLMVIGFALLAIFKNTKQNRLRTEN
ncbi:hypothetical protein EHQ99_10965 [Leptospira bouyouniensis]|nr:hypothetical protein EHQ99_10965 [Leptospira bouyouniensis]